MKNYQRVIPRDFFNEAKLLKCMGLLALKILDNNLPSSIQIKIEESGEPFDIELSDDGHLFVSNYPVTINGEVVLFKTSYNSKSNYPFFCEIDYTDYEVFDEQGNFTEEFIELFTIKQPTGK